MNGGGATADVVLGLGLGFDPEYGEREIGSRWDSWSFFSPREQVASGACGGMAAQCCHCRHTEDDSPVLPVKNTGSSGENNKARTFYFIRVLKQVQKIL